jgi:hypothetical protein
MASSLRCDRFSRPASLLLPPDAPAMINQEGPDLLEMIFVAFVLAGIAYSFTH